jgi:type I restriction enzyme M protein
VEKFRIIAVVSLPQHTFAHVKAGVKSSILFLKKHPEALTRHLETILSDIKEKVRKEKELSKETKEERAGAGTLYKEKTVQYDYDILMYDVEHIGYDATGKKIEGSELSNVATQINDFIIDTEL